MQYSEFAGERVSKFGVGAMRLPTLEGGAIDEEQVARMVDYAAEHGVNYFDTAYPYHNCLSEVVLGRALKQLPRDSYFLATKYPGHQTAQTYNPAEIFEEQLRKCDVDHFDFYLLHNVCEKSFGVYTDPRWGIVDYFLEQRRAGRIHHLGFSTHAMLPCLEEFLGLYGDEMEFAQIQMNYLDWTLQDGPAKYRLLGGHSLDVIVMEPVRGGALADLGEAANARLKALDPERSVASWALRWQLGTPAKVVLSGVSNMEQLADNVATFTEAKPLTDEETEVLYQIAEGMKNSVPCTGCRYCCDGCPQELDIPQLIKLANDARVATSVNLRMTVDSLPEGKRPSDCIGCRACEAICPQNIPIPDVLAELVERMESVPRWDDVCKQREEAARKLREAQAAGASE